jgi:hypothetical protein
VAGKVLSPGCSGNKQDRVNSYNIQGKLEKKLNSGTTALYNTLGLEYEHNGLVQASLFTNCGTLKNPQLSKH